jgi:hypothetical protein
VGEVRCRAARACVGVKGWSGRVEGREGERWKATGRNGKRRQDRGKDKAGEGEKRMEWRGETV